MELQIVHKATTDGHIGEKLVISLLFRQTDNPGVSNSFIAKHLNNWTKVPSPDPYNREKKMSGQVSLADLFSKNGGAQQASDLGQLISNIEFP